MTMVMMIIVIVLMLIKVNDTDHNADEYYWEDDNSEYDNNN